MEIIGVAMVGFSRSNPPPSMLETHLPLSSQLGNLEEVPQHFSGRRKRGSLSVTAHSRGVSMDSPQLAAEREGAMALPLGHSWWW